MKKCPNCGEDLQDQDVFCTYCGEKVESETAPTPVTIEPAAEPASEATPAAAEIAPEATPVAVEAAPAATEATPAAVEQTADATSAAAGQTSSAVEPTPVAAEKAPEYARYTVEEKKKKGFSPLIFIGLFLLLAIVVVAVFSFGKNLFSGGLNLSPEQKFLNYQYDYLENKFKALEDLGFLVRKRIRKQRWFLPEKWKGTKRLINIWRIRR